ncbi:MAG: hypothetical protein NDI68_04675, partial [Arenimonas sp.]|nr:hypothetical protein [Arenimonas sp.]
MRWRALRSVRGKLYAILALTTVLALTVASAALLVFHLASERADAEQDLLTQADVIALASAPALAFADEVAAVESLSVLRARPTVRAAALYDVQGRLLVSWFPNGGDGAVPPQAQAPGLQLDGDLAVAWRPVRLRQERVGTLYLRM